MASSHPRRQHLHPGLRRSACLRLHNNGRPDPLTDTAPLVADLRWIGARILRSAPYASTVSATNQVATTTTDTTDTAPQQSPVSTVVEMLNSWQQTLP